MRKLIVMVIGLAVALTAVALAGERADAAILGSGSGALPAVAEADTYDSDAEYAAGVVDIELGDTISVDGEGVVVEGKTVRITASGVYSLSGTLADGRIEVDAQGKVYLEFEGVDITSSGGPALSVIDAKKVTVTLAAGSTNYLSDTADSSVGTSFSSDDTAALVSNDTLIINGSGTLVITGNNNEAISSDDDLIIDSGTIRVTAVDDGLNAHDAITINGGDVLVCAGGDGLDSNGKITINGGTVAAFGGTAEGDGGIDTIGAFIINGGTVIAGGNTIAPMDGESTQCSVYVASVAVQPAGTTLSLEREGEELLTFTPGCSYQNVFISMSGLVRGASYQTRFGDATGIASTAVR